MVNYRNPTRTYSKGQWREKRYRRERKKFSQSSFDSRSEKRGLFLMAVLICFIVSVALNFWFEASR